ncbi:hypothetical protein Baya_12805 [Bagarius yarrelli]|uniref:Uncharacterized protein n=1 Tax=Bagarius yarrelli TaxID=175774 RepID=A0A556V4H4_BAGYA|nr:hypothetical protein Baya_12805 [Bagarius yarrelli]
MKVVFIAVCLIALVSAVPVDKEHEREKRSSSGESNRGFGGQFPPSFYPYFPNNNNDIYQALLPFILLQLLTPAPAPPPPPPPPPPPAGK